MEFISSFPYLFTTLLGLYKTNLSMKLMYNLL